MQNFKPLLAAPVELDKLRLPVMVSPKIDGIRAVTGTDPHRPHVSTRSLKSVPNRHIQHTMVYAPDCLDGEIVTYTDGVMDDFNTVQSKVMSTDGRPDFKFHVFDCWDPLMIRIPFRERFEMTADLVESLEFPWLWSVPHTTAHTIDELIAFEAQAVRSKWEGIMLRDPNGGYKFGRSTVKEGILLKMKRFDDSEAIVTWCVQRMRNHNSPTVNALGYQERSHKKENMVPDEALGALSVVWGDLTFEIGSGFTEEQRVDFWKNRNALIGSKVTFKYQGVGSQGRPRFPVFVGFRKDI